MTSKDLSTTLKTEEVEITSPAAEDGPAVTQLIADCPPLDANSAYCNLLQCSHFRHTSAVARKGGRLIGFVSGYRIPDKANTLFIWQVAVSAEARGLGLARAMLNDLVSRSENAGLLWIETTITANNDASWAMFEGFARSRNAMTKRTVMFDRHQHFGGRHDTEYLLRIGPVGP